MGLSDIKKITRSEGERCMKILKTALAKACGVYEGDL